MLDRQVDELEREINAWHRQDAASRRLQGIPGIGPLTASALVASVGDAKIFRNGRQFAAWLGLVPKQNSSGGKTTLKGISKRGDTYLRTMLIHGARGAFQFEAPPRAGGRMAGANGGTASSEHRRGGIGQQERTDRVGAARAWP